MTEHHLLLSEPISPRQIEELLERHHRDLPIVTYLYTETMDSVDTHLWEGVNKRATLKLVDDAQLEAHYLIVTASNPVVADKIRNVLRENLPVRSCEQLQDAMEADLAAAPTRLIQLTLCGDGERSDRSCELIIRGLNHQDATVRRAAAQAVALLRTSELLDVADERLDIESDEEVARLLNAALVLGERD